MSRTYTPGFGARCVCTTAISHVYIMVIAYDSILHVWQWCVVYMIYMAEVVCHVIMSGIEGGGVRCVAEVGGVWRSWAAITYISSNDAGQVLQMYLPW